MIISALKHEEMKKEPNAFMNSSFDELTQETSTDPEHNGQCPTDKLRHRHIYFRTITFFD